MVTGSPLAFSGAGGAESGVALEYVSMRGPQGDITLRLRLDSSFLLELRYWDKEEHRHTHCEEASGTWDYDDGILTLKGERKVVYRRDKILFRWGESGILVGVDALLWVSSTQSMFADSFELFEKSAVDHFVERTAFMPLFPAVSVSFGDTVRIRATPATESLDLAGLVPSTPIAGWSNQGRSSTRRSTRRRGRSAGGFRQPGWPHRSPAPGLDDLLHGGRILIVYRPLTSACSFPLFDSATFKLNFAVDNPNVGDLTKNEYLASEIGPNTREIGIESYSTFFLTMGKRYSQETLNITAKTNQTTYIEAYVCTGTGRVEAHTAVRDAATALKAMHGLQPAW